MGTIEHMFASAGRSELGFLRIALIGAFILAIPVALITTNIRVAISEQAVYDHSVRKYDAARVSGIPESELIRANGIIRDYLTNPDAGPLAIQVVNDRGETETLFTARETVHMADVHSLVQLMFTVQVGAVALALALAVVMIALWPARALAAAMLYGSAVTFAVLGAAGLLAAIGFDAAWSQFHGLAFTNDFWELDPDTDHLIQMYPEAFWQEVTLGIGGFIAVQAFAIAAISATYLFLTRDRGNVIEARPRTEQPDRDGHPRRPRLAPPNPRHYVQ
jgi:integral membrane protein (TIGR01906 family)